MSRTARNTLYSVVGLGLPLVVAVLCIPPVLAGLGPERFGLLALGWTLLGYFGVLDLGVGRATTKYVAERVEAGDVDAVAEITWTGAALQAAVGAAAALLLLALTPLLAERVLTVPPALVDEAERSFRVLAVGIPLALLSNAFRGALEGAHRFDVVALTRVPLTSANYMLPLVGVWAGLGLPAVFALLVGARAVGTLAYALQCARTWPGRFAPRLARGREARRLLGYGGWIALSGALIPLFIYLDRFLIGALRSLAEVTYYTAPYEVASRLLFVPAGLAGVLFPLYSGLASRGDARGIARSTSGALRWTAALMAPLAAVVIVAAPALLDAWLGPDVAAHSAGVLRILAAAVFVNALGYPAVALVEGVGRPDLVAKIHMVELPLYAVVVVVLIHQGGIAGAALAWLLRMAWHIPLLFMLSARASGLALRETLGGATARALLLSSGLVAAAAATTVLGAPVVAYGALAGLLALFAALTWRGGLDEEDRRVARAMLTGTRPPEPERPPVPDPR